MELGISQRSMSQSGLTGAYISRVERGDRVPTLNALLVIAEALDVSVGWILTGKDDAPCIACGAPAQYGTRTRSTEGTST
jgi:transcriptional regulator with XRE-family HTH domain